MYLNDKWQMLNNVAIYYAMIKIFCIDLNDKCWKLEVISNLFNKSDWMLQENKLKKFPFNPQNCEHNPKKKKKKPSQFKDNSTTSCSYNFLKLHKNNRSHSIHYLLITLFPHS